MPHFRCTLCSYADKLPLRALHVAGFLLFANVFCLQLKYELFRLVFCRFTPTPSLLPPAVTVDTKTGWAVGWVRFLFLFFSLLLFYFIPFCHKINNNRSMQNLPEFGDGAHDIMCRCSHFRCQVRYASTYGFGRSILLQLSQPGHFLMGVEVRTGSIHA